MTISDVKIEFQSELHNIYPKNEITAIFGLLLSDIGYSQTDIVINSNSILTSIHIEYMQQALSQLSNHVPVQYFRQKADFYGLEFFVNSSVLIPRQETELLVHTIIKNTYKTPQTIVDIGTGSGCIAITIAKHITEAHVFALDISAQALEVATHNASLHNVQVRFIEADMCNKACIEQIPMCTILVSNPPYVCTKEQLYMKQHVLDFEPHTALFVPDNNPLLYFEALAYIGLHRLHPNGMILCEINEALGNETKAVFEQNGYMNCSILNDLHNKNRFVQAFKQ